MTLHTRWLCTNHAHEPNKCVRVTSPWQTCPCAGGTCQHGSLGVGCMRARRFLLLIVASSILHPLLQYGSNALIRPFDSGYLLTCMPLPTRLPCPRHRPSTVARTSAKPMQTCPLFATRTGRGGAPPSSPPPASGTSPWTSARTTPPLPPAQTPTPPMPLAHQSIPFHPCSQHLAHHPLPS
jgi:hypothetical protein